MLAAALALAVTRPGMAASTALDGLVRADALSEFMLIVIGAVGLLATAASPAWLRGEIAAGRATARTAARHSVLVQLFLAAMAVAVLAASLGVTWVAIEAHHDRHRVPRRPAPHQGRPSRPPGST